MKSAVSSAAKTRLLVGTGLVLLAAPLSAQGTESEPGNAISEIVVTAQKREQNLQDVPIAISAIGVLIFAGLTAYDTQKIKESYSASFGAEVLAKGAIMGALNLYLDFINLFLMLLRLFGLYCLQIGDDCGFACAAGPEGERGDEQQGVEKLAHGGLRSGMAEDVVAAGLTRADYCQRW